MEQIEYPVVSQKGKEVGKAMLKASVFNADVNEDLVHATVVWQRNKKRSGTHSTLTKGAMEGGAKKPWKQKGTGRARAGDSNSPLWVGGAVAHGPHPRKYESRLSKRARKQALLSVLTSKCQNKKIVIVDSFALKTHKTKDCAAVIKSLGLTGKKTLLVVENEIHENVERAARNLTGISIAKIDGINVYSLVNNSVLLITKAGLEALQENVAKE
jgi:large subunit ribosomal protein L4